jgi:hypothetical protein
MKSKLYEGYVISYVLVNEPETRLFCLKCTSYIESDGRKVPER